MMALSVLAESTVGIAGILTKEKQSAKVDYQLSKKTTHFSVFNKFLLLLTTNIFHSLIFVASQKYAIFFYKSQQEYTLYNLSTLIFSCIIKLVFI
jgi:hypothetical protein